jgi:hypothetical protein
MAMTTPKFEFEAIAYFKESAALGFIEAVRINGVHLGKNGWMYSINMSLSPPTAGFFTERRSMVNTQIIYYSEDELLTECEAFTLATESARLNYVRLDAQKQVLCPDDPTAGTE